MNKELQDFARKTLLDGLNQLEDAHRLLFKRMYSHKNLEASIEDVVASIPEDKLDWAMQQVERTPKPNKEKGLLAGEACNRNDCNGVIEEHPVENCSCHISPPCSQCVEPREYCPACEWEA